MFAVTDVETTGLYPTDRVVEIGIILIDSNGTVVDEWDTLLNPERDVGRVDEHDITATMVSAAPTFEDVRWAVAERIDGAVLVAHNLDFVERMLGGEFDRSEGNWHPGVGVSTLQTAPGKLAQVCAEHGIKIENPHRALCRARAIAELLTRTALASDLDPIPTTVDKAPRRISRTLRREAFPEASGTRSTDSSVAEWSLSIDHSRYPRDDVGYIDLLDRALDDLWLSAEEMVELTTLAQLAGISPDRLPALHKMYVADLYEAALRDGVINDDEFRQLDAVSQALGFQLGDLYPEFEQYRPVEVAIDEIAAGTKVAFTGTAIHPVTGAKLDRSDLAAISIAAGLVPLDRLTKADTDLLVAADPNSQSGKAKKARQWGIAVISVDEFIERFGTETPQSSPSMKQVDDDRDHANELTGAAVPVSAADVTMLAGVTRQDAVGESFYQEALISICDGHSDDGDNLPVLAVLQPEPDNPYDKNAVAVVVEGKQIGYLPKVMAAVVHTSLVALSSATGKFVGCRCEVVGGWDRGPADRGKFGVRLFFDVDEIHEGPSTV